jgi:16S rRNA C967 or C1407 C5-methylase (RsmB/RsmF family)
LASNPSRLLRKLSRRLFSEEADQAAFVHALTQPQPLHPCILWCGDRPSSLPFSVEPHRPEQPAFVDRLPLDAQPGKHPLHNEGDYYCLDYSSVMSASVLLAVPRPVNVVVDMCASPGGKSLFAWRSLRPSILLSNEVIGKRTAALISNLKRCGARRVEGTQVRETRAIALSLDSSVLAEKIPGLADVVMVDAPCTGQSLLAKGGKAEGCFHPVTINRNANRQKRILANSAQLVAPQGYLAYMTCAYSPEENEGVMEWLLKQCPEFVPVEVPSLANFQSPLSDRPCYRVWPQSSIGAGGFTVLLHNTRPGTLPPPSDGSPDIFLTLPTARPIERRSIS